MKLLTLVCLFAFAVCAFAGIHPELQNKIANASADESFHILVAMKDQPSLSDIKADMRGDEESVRVEAIQTLKNKAEESQHFIKGMCEGRNSGVSNFRSFWIANMCSMNATPAVIRDLALLPEVAEIYLDEEQTFIQYFPGTEQMRAAWGLDKIGSKNVNAKGFKGNGIIVAVIDTGVNYRHQDLAGRVLQGKDCVNNDNDADDDHGHGSHCAGTIAGTTYGVAPEATIVPVKVLSGSGSGTWEGVAAGVQYVADYNVNGKRIDIASMSLGGGPPIQPVLKTAFENAKNAGIIFAVAAGNSGPGKSTIGTPGDLTFVTSVGATDISDKIASFSSRGPVTAYGTPYTKPDVSAPGVNITSCWIGGTTASNTISGTSMATPHVAGLMALILNAKGKMSADRVREILETTAIDMGDAGKDNTFGSGRVRAVEATESALLGDQRVEIEVEVNFVIAQDGSLNVEITKENPLWDMKVKVQGTILEPAGVYSASFSIRSAGKNDQSGSVANLPAGQLYAFPKLFTLYEGENTLVLKGTYVGEHKGATGKAKVKAIAQD